MPTPRKTAAKASTAPKKAPVKAQAKTPAKAAPKPARAAAPAVINAPYISPHLLALAVPIDSVLQDDRNARKHDEKNRAGVRCLLQEYGQLIPIVADRETKRIIKGNCTHSEAREMGWEYIAVNFVDFKPGQATAFGLDDNRIGELGTWDYQMAAGNMRELQEYEEFARLHAWTPADVEPLLQAEWKPPKVANSPALTNIIGAASAPGTNGITTNTNNSGASTPPPPPEHDANNAKPIVVTPAQRETIEEAIERVRLMNDDHAMSEGRCIELICGDYNAGA